MLGAFGMGAWSKRLGIAEIEELARVYLIMNGAWIQMQKQLLWPVALLFAAGAALSACSKGDKTSSGEEREEGKVTQVVARVGGEEITIHQLNAELGTVPRAAVQDPEELQKAVLRVIVFRTAMRQAAIKEKLDRDPDVKLLEKAATDKLLADAYLKRQTGSTPPPTTNEVDQYIVEHALQFDDRRLYQFARMTIPTDQYSDLLVQLFDEKQTFAELEAYLKEKSVPYALNDVQVLSSEFPQDVQDQLARFKAGDNIVVRNQQSVVILKIRSWAPTPLPRDQSRAIAQNTLHQQAIQERARSIQKALPTTTKIEFLGKFAGMPFIENSTVPPQNQGETPANTNPATSPADAPAPQANPGQEGEDR